MAVRQPRAIVRDNCQYPFRLICDRTTERDRPPTQATIEQLESQRGQPDGSPTAPV